MVSQRLLFTIWEAPALLLTFGKPVFECGVTEIRDYVNGALSHASFFRFQVSAEFLLVGTLLAKFDCWLEVEVRNATLTQSWPYKLYSKDL